MSPPQLRIAIVGAGPAGLTLAFLLHKRGISFTIFELRHRPADEEFAKPSGSLDLHEDSGLAALSECGLLEEFSLLTGDCTEEQKLSDKNGNIIYADDGGLANRPEISRNKIIKLLLSYLPTSMIKWGHKLVSAKRSTASNHTDIELDFGENGKETFNFVVGADGAWSKVRSLLTDVKPQYAGMQVISLSIRQVETEYPHLAELIGRGTLACLGDRHGICSQRSVEDSAWIYIFISTNDEHFPTTSGLRLKTAAEAKDQLVGDDSLFSLWGASIKDLVTIACDDESVHNSGAKIDIKTLYKLPIGHTWTHQSGATLIGDGSHLQNPPAGEGVNIAMKDALQLSQSIIKAHEIAGQDLPTLLSVLDALIEEFEVDMARRAKEMAEGTLMISEMMFGGEDGATALANWFKTFGPPPE